MGWGGVEEARVKTMGVRESVRGEGKSGGVIKRGEESRIGGEENKNRGGKKIRRRRVDGKGGVGGGKGGKEE